MEQVTGLPRLSAREVPEEVSTLSSEPNPTPVLAWVTPSRQRLPTTTAVVGGVVDVVGEGTSEGENERRDERKRVEA